MSYSNRVYRQRNPHTHDKDNEQPSFFGKSGQEKNGKSNAPFFQTKLNIGQPNDVYEKEADTVASKVVNNQSSSPVVQQKEIKSVQKLATPKEEERLSTNEDRMREDKMVQEKPEVQRMCSECEKEKEDGKEKVQKKAENGGAASTHLSSRIEGSKGKGSRLPNNTLREMNNSFGVDFSHVSIHTDDEAKQMSRELSAQAFTYGSDVYFNSGKYDTNSLAGKELLAHELTHVVQQKGEVIQRQETGGIFDSVSEVANNFLSNSCVKTTSVVCPGTSSNFKLLGYIGPMMLLNTGTCTLFVHGIGENGSPLNHSFVEIPSGEQRFFMPSPDAVDTAVVCKNDCKGTGHLQHPYYCA